MFTGIVQGIAQIHAIKDSDNFRTQIVKLPAEMRKGLEIGASVANNGVCLTVTEIHDDLVSFDLMQETLRITNLGSLKAGDFVNIERAMQMGAEIGGHILSGHVYCTASVSQIIEYINSENGKWIDREMYSLYLLEIISRFAIREKGNINREMVKSFQTWISLLKYLQE